ncbi:hypothetical protein DER46DRAFT_688541 [Fusarium sp. MPI-SDFR-AT-0072]|nr:hypothetical protein DER46DRAFT_688541 [Fusarium sp. MPI-SDFR-AT-0072]
MSEPCEKVYEMVHEALRTTCKSINLKELESEVSCERFLQVMAILITNSARTVLFFPLSFLSSLFSLDVASFQQAPAWAFYIIFFMSAGISLILGFGVFYWDNVKHAKHKIFDIVEKAFEGDSKQISSQSSLPEKGGSERKDIGRRDKPISIPSKSKDGEPGFMSRFWGHRRKDGADDIENGAAISRG